MPFDTSPPNPDQPARLEPAVKQHWISALRSGRWEQIRGRHAAGATGRCAMGVYLEAVYGCADFIAAIEAGDPFFAPCLMSRVGRIRLKIQHMNDSGASFAQIANWIEGNAEI